VLTSISFGTYLMFQIPILLPTASMQLIMAIVCAIAYKELEWKELCKKLVKKDL
jgi:hypothetical protein